MQSSRVVAGCTSLLPLQVKPWHAFPCKSSAAAKKDYGECDLECVHMPMRVEVSVIADSRKIGEGRRIKIYACRISA
jgi:hypothetical protein